MGAAGLRTNAKGSGGRILPGGQMTADAICALTGANAATAPSN